MGSNNLVNVIEWPIVIPSKRKVVEPTPERKAEQAEKVKWYKAKITTLEEEKAFLKKINQEEPHEKKTGTSISENLEMTEKSNWLLPGEQNRTTISEIEVNSYPKTNSCFASMAKLHLIKEED